MASESETPRRRSIRLPGYDYAEPGAYFVTICTRKRECVLGRAHAETVVLSRAGKIVASAWQGLRARFPHLDLDAFIIMPNHVHGVVVLGELVPGGLRPTARNRAPTLGEVVRTFKAVSTRLIRSTHRPTFAWQRNYYEHVIRNEMALRAIRLYVESNPLLWSLDGDNPKGGALGLASVNRAQAKGYGFSDHQWDFVVKYDNQYRGLSEP